MIHLLAASSLALAQDCEAPIPSAMLDAKIANIRTSIENKDMKQLQTKMEDLQRSVDCLVQPITPAQAADFHLLQGITLWIGRQQNLAQLHFSAAKEVSPGIAIPGSLFPAAHQIHQSLDQSPLLPDGEELQVPAGGALFFDGSETALRPLYRPTVYQRTQDGRMQETLRLEANAPLDMALASASPVAEAASAASAEGDGETVRAGKVAITAATGTIAAISMGLAISADRQAGDLEPGNYSQAEATQLRNRNYIGLGGAVVAGGAAVALGFTW
jgi:hypothetical protein